MTKFRTVLLATAAFITATTSLAFSQGWGGVSSNSIERVSDETFIVDIAPATTSTGTAKEITLDGVEAGDTYTDFTFGGVRTFAARLTQNGEDAVSATFRIDGMNQFGGLSSEVFTLDADEVVIGSIPFVAKPEPVLTFTAIADNGSTDTLSIYSYGWGIRSSPAEADNVLSELVKTDDSPDTYTEEVHEGDWSFTTRYNPTYSTYTNADLTQHDEVWFKFITSGRIPSSVGSASQKGLGPAFRKTVSNDPE